MNTARTVDHAYIASTIAFTVYSQLVLRWQVGSAGAAPQDVVEKIRFVASLLINPWVLSGILATFLAGVSWMLAMTRFEISYAYPFVSLNYVLVMIASVVWFDEQMSPAKVAGTLLIVAGIIVVSKG
jgi:drug/metabolite transporter (DMT)-like permease